MSKEKKTDSNELGKIRKILDIGSLEKVTFALDLLDSLGAGDEDYAKLFTKTRIKKLIAGDAQKFNFLAEKLYQFRETNLRFNEVIKGFSQNNFEYLIADLTELSDGAAKILSGLNWHALRLDGYNAEGGPTFISDNAAESLSKFGGLLYLNGLEELSDKTAESLSKYKGGRLALSGISKLSDAAAESFSRFKGNNLDLDGVTSLSDAAANSLSKCKCDLSLSGLTSLSEAAANSLSNCKSNQLTLSGLTSLSEAAVKSLSQFKGSHLSLSGLASLSDSAAESLSKYKGGSTENSGWLSLYGLKDLSDSAVDRLSKFSGKSLSLNGVKKLSDMQAKSLSKLSNDLRMLDLHELSDIAAQYFAKSTGHLNFPFDLREKINQYRDQDHSAS